VNSGVDPFASRPLHALLLPLLCFLPFSFPPRNGAARTRAKKRLCGSGRKLLLSVLRTDAAAPPPPRLKCRSLRLRRQDSSLQTRPTHIHRNSPRVFAYANHRRHLPTTGRPAGRIRNEMRPAPLRLRPSALSSLGVGPPALRGTVSQSPNTIYQSHPLCPSLHKPRPSTPERACFRVQGQGNGRAIYIEPASGLDVALPDSVGLRFSAPSHGARYGVSGPQLASLSKTTQPPFRAGRPPQRVPRGFRQRTFQTSRHLSPHPNSLVFCLRLWDMVFSGSLTIVGISMQGELIDQTSLLNQ